MHRQINGAGNKNKYSIPFGPQRLSEKLISRRAAKSQRIFLSLVKKNSLKFYTNWLKA